ncbi:N-acetylmuramoyl-L-alanine amidase, partial [Metaclostridioides mangenotii]|uniref:N-acetylmuramoyl-L-alanine amidase n=1 Tax=Metaclostridioides mangenotii TaxID=1540 RepID=UPI0031DF485E
KEGHTVNVIICPEKQFTSKSQEQPYKLSRINGKCYDLVIELHLNSSDNKNAKGVEVIYYQNSSKGKAYAERIEKKIVGLGITSRGAKKQTEFVQKSFYILSGTDCPAVIIESFFCTNKTEVDLVNKLEYKAIAIAILEGILNKTIDDIISKKYTNGIIYSGDRDKAVAIIMKEFLPNSTIVDIADYKSYICRNAYAIGGGASRGLEKFPDNVTEFVGNDFKETYRKVVEWLENRKYM